MPSKPTHLVASSAGDIKFDDFVVASTISKMERDATGRPLELSMSSGTQATRRCRKRPSRRNFADCAVRPPCAPATIGLRPSRRLGASEKESR